MDIIQQLFSQYSIEAIIILIISLSLAIKFMSELWEWFYNKFKNHFTFRTQKDQNHTELVNEIRLLQETVKTLTNKISDFDKKQKITTERLQESTRSHIIDKHHYFCYEVRAIDDLSLQSLERHFLYYKAAGGNSFIDGLMEEVRELPRINYQNYKDAKFYMKNERGEE